MAITPSSRWISKDGGSDEDSVPFEKSKKACFQFSATLGLRTVLPGTPYSVSDRFILKIAKRGARCRESAPTSSILADKTKYDEEIKHHKSYLKREFMLTEVRNNYQRGPIFISISHL